MDNATKMHGQIVLTTSKYVVRAKDNDGYVQIMVNPLKDGVEHRPLAYLEGFNWLDNGRKR